jgi:epoxyqueuosine reductase QueG
LLHLEALIRKTIEEMVQNAGTETSYRPPLIAFASAANPGFARLPEIVTPEHLLPEQLLPGAQSAVAFFLPFAEEVVVANQRASYVAQEWAVAYVETNQLIGRICQRLTDMLAERGVRAAAEPATHNFDPVSLVSRWSHKSVAAVAGLGSFGLHHMLITDAGCAGRFGSLVTDVELEPTPVVEEQRCLYCHDGSCQQCVEFCPVGALTEEGLDKKLCYRRCLEVDAYFADLGLTDVCGKCAVGLCALGSAV